MNEEGYKIVNRFDGKGICTADVLFSKSFLITLGVGCMAQMGNVGIDINESLSHGMGIKAWIAHFNLKALMSTARGGTRNKIHLENFPRSSLKRRSWSWSRVNCESFKNDKNFISPSFQFSKL